MKTKLKILTAGAGLLLSVAESNAQWLNNTPTTIYNGPTSVMVGIGTGAAFTPTDRLHVKGGNILLDYTGTVSGSVNFGALPGGSTTGMRMLFNNTSSSTYHGGYIDVRTGTAFAAQGLRIRVDNSTGSTERMRITGEGRVGIATSSPEDVFQVGWGLAKVNLGTATGGNVGYGNSYIGFNASHQQATGMWSTASDGANNGGAVIYGDVAGNINFAAIENTGNINRNDITDVSIKDTHVKMRIFSNGNVVIGSGLPSSAYKLDVCGDLRAKKIVVETGWCDFVFDKDYTLRTLEETEKFILANGHLPEVPPASEIETKGGDLGALVKIHMQKIEELTLYLIEQNKKIESLTKQNLVLAEKLTTK